MTDSIVAYQAQLNSFGIAFHRAVLNNLAESVENAIKDERIRSQDGLHSIYDFIREVLGRKNPYDVWKAFQKQDPISILEISSIRFLDESQTKTTPVTDFVGLFYRKNRGQSKTPVFQAGDTDNSGGFSLKLDQSLLP